MPRCRPISACQPPGARKGTLRSPFAPTRHDLSLPKLFRGAILLETAGNLANVGLNHGGNAADFGPDPECLGPGGSVLGGSGVIAAELEEIIDLIVS